MPDQSKRRGGEGESKIFQHIVNLLNVFFYIRKAQLYKICIFVIFLFNFYLFNIFIFIFILLLYSNLNILSPFFLIENVIL